MNDSKWTGLSWGTLGDSITEANGYQPLVAEALGFARVVNYGRGGCPVTAGGDRDHGATVHMAREADPTLDCVTIFAGVNDFRLNKPIGLAGTRDIFTFRGAYVTAAETILRGNPGCRLNLWTPLQRDKDEYDNTYVNKAGHRLIDYVEAIRSIGLAYALPVLDLYAESGFNKLTLPLLTSDGLHPNEAGQRRIASMAASFLERL
ncbi:SGNH/GDSL hydrolase family protein [Cohnella nanjingensis]|uniref:SGNH/GDSL hydrolase family protein n=1 Tax=Cohnella nanjingensis TaxID=1387779 RepID=A0A7X0RTJ6_9BACL|nr:SGNH/GDSL hydrolase family protein [Cohnella nanjingensis]MBB6673452.1 SGNH/GDSL hydrolase family protein [Cohnella nanjingensis]